MLGLKLRPEFAGNTITGTVVSLNKSVSDSFVNIPTSQALEVTYPTADLLHALEACFSPDSKRYLVIMGERGQGKSHIMGVIHHAFKEPTAFMAWLDQWKSKLSYSPKIAVPPKNFLVITTALHEQGHEFLWSPIFESHPDGARLQGKWEAKRETIPVLGKADLLEALEKKPVALIFDEFQTWYANLHGKAENWAFNFIQILSEIAKERPDLLRLVVSVRNGESDAYKQLHRIGPAIVNFQGSSSKLDRQKLLIHRLFSNRGQISNEQIKGATSLYFEEWCRLLNKPGSEKTLLQDQLVTAWPFSLDLLNVLDEQIMVATHAQETRDLIKLLAFLFRSVGENEPIITPAHFGLDEERNSELDALIAAVGTANLQKLAKYAKRNVEAVRDALRESCPPFTERALASLYVRSLSMGRQKGASREQIQADVSSSVRFDDNIFRDQWANIADNSYNVHEKQGHYYFDVPENARTKVIAHAKNAKLFEQGQDVEKILSVIEFAFAPKMSADRDRFRWAVLGRNWQDVPFRAGSYKGKHPTQDLGDGQPCYVFVPEHLENGKLVASLSRFLKEHIPRYKNLVRFVLPDRNIFDDKEILLYGRALYFADQWKADKEYQDIASQFNEKLQDAVGKAFRRVLILERWDNEDSKNVQFAEIQVETKPHQMFGDVDDTITTSYFSVDEFNSYIESSVHSNHLERQKLSFLRSILEEPSPFPKQVVPWTNPTHIFEVILKGVQDGKFALQTNAGVIQVSPTRSPDQIKRDVQKPQWNRWDTLHVVPLVGSTGGAGIPGMDKPNGQPKGDPARPDSSGAPIPPNGNPISRIVRELGFPQSPLLVLGEIERWGIAKNAKLHDVNIVFSNLSVEELSKVLKAMDNTVQDREINLKLVVTEEGTK